LNIRVEAGYISGYDLYELGGKGHVGSRWEKLMVSTSDPGISLRRWLVSSVMYLSKRYVSDVKVATIGLPGNVWLADSIF
jgi:hypothetical protein